MRYLISLVVGVWAIGCSVPPPTSTAAIAREPTTLFWGDAKTPIEMSTQSQLDPPLDFVVVAGSGTSGGEGHAQKVWLDAIEAADEENEACVFTSFIGWESPATDGDHATAQITFIEQGAEEARELNPSEATASADLSAWLAKTSKETGTELVTIPDLTTIGSTPAAPGELAIPKAGEVGFGGLVGAWAEENTRASIFAAFERHEIYATSGPRIRVRFFGGWAFDGKLAKSPAMVTEGYTLGYPMGSHLPVGPKGKAPGFMMYAVKDPKGADLDRIQVVKGWVDGSGKAHEHVYDAVLPQASEPSRKERKKGIKPTPADELTAPSLFGFWADPQFDATQPAYYYMRALEVATPATADTDASEASTSRPHAYSSAIWYSPAPSSATHSDD